MSRRILGIEFSRSDGVVEWWDVLFTDRDEARRWAEHELSLRRRRKGRWRAELIEGHWDNDEPEFGEPLEIVWPRWASS